MSRTLANGPAGARIREILGDLVVASFSSVPQHVPASALLAAASLAREQGVDSVVSLGGGTQVDCAKAVALCLAGDVKSAGDLDRYRARQSGDGRVLMPQDPGPLLPVFTVATALSGAEHTDMTGITDDETRVKHVFRFADLAPRAVILDAEMARYTPAPLWASSGVRALDHSVESMLSVAHNPFRDALGTKAIAMLRENLLRSTLDPDDLAARGACLEAAWMSSFGILSTGAGLSHAIGHQLAPQFGVFHGVSSAIMLPVVMEFNAPFTREQLDRVATAIRTPEDDPADDAPVLVRRFIETLPVPTSISAIGGTRDVFPGMATEIINDPTFPVTPRPVTESDIVELLEAAWV
jgi:alcohol dehydrogenase